MGLPANRLSAAIKIVKSNLLRKEALNHNKRIDGRSLDQVRPIATELGLFNRTHGSALLHVVKRKRCVLQLWAPQPPCKNRILIRGCR